MYQRLILGLLLSATSFICHADQGDAGTFTTEELISIETDTFSKRCFYSVSPEYIEKVQKSYMALPSYSLYDSQGNFIMNKPLPIKVSVKVLRGFDCPENKTFLYNKLEGSWRDIN
ncbi:hypothetical protein P7M43_04670 [Vibrio parahaemolyticus]|nr:hypothetical protein [Vibrio parahaemolyticus]